MTQTEAELEQKLIDRLTGLGYERQRIRQRANFFCEYCHSSEEASFWFGTYRKAICCHLGGLVLAVLV